MSGMRKVVLVRHAAPAIRTDVASEEWVLSPDGRDAAVRLAEELRRSPPVAIASSPELKALETARILARAHAVDVSVYDGLREHQRRTVTHLPKEVWERSIAELFRRADDVVFGEESARAALTRIRAAVFHIMRAHPRGDLWIVTHGTVLALLLGSITGEDAHRIWQRMPLPCWCVLSDPPLTVLEQPAGV